MSEQDVVRTPDHVLVNRASWDDDAPNWVERGRTSWASEPHWGIWGVPESQLGLLPDDLAGLDAIEIGCGVGRVALPLSRQFARRGARPVGLDNSSRQLATARLLQSEFDISFPLVHGDGERLPFHDGSFDYAVSEYGAAIWCEPAGGRSGFPFDRPPTRGRRTPWRLKSSRSSGDAFRATWCTAISRKRPTGPSQRSEPDEPAAPGG